MTRHVFSLLLLVAGLLLVGTTAGWPAMVGVFLAMWGNNLNRERP